MILAIKFKKNTYTFFCIKLLLLLCMVFVLDFSIGKTLRYFYFKQKTGRQFRATFAIEKTTADILIFGSSRAYHHYVPDIIEDSLKETCYNTGSPGQFLLYNYATLKAVLKRYSPKMIILDVTAGDLREERESYDRLSFLLPYYKNHEEIRSIIDLKSPFEKYKLISSIYPFNSTFLMIAGGNSEYFKKRNLEIKGYKPLLKTWTEIIEVRNSEIYKLDGIKLNIFSSFIKDCINARTKIYVVCSPSYIKYRQIDYSVSSIEKIAKKQNVEFIDFTNDSTFVNHPNLFDDPSHLNAKGSELFTRIVIGNINNRLKIYKILHRI